MQKTMAHLSWAFAVRCFFGYLDCVVFGSTVKSAVTRRGVSHLRYLVIGVERLEAGSRLFLSERRYYGIHVQGFIEFSWSSLVSGLAVFALCYFVRLCLPLSVVFHWLCYQSDGRLRNPLCLLNKFAGCVLVMWLHEKPPGGLLLGCFW